MTSLKASPQMDQLMEAQRRTQALTEIRDRLVIDAYLAGHSYRQIGDVLGRTSEAVRKKYSSGINEKFDALRASRR